MEPKFQCQTEYTFEEYKKYNRMILYKVKNVNRTIMMLEIILLLMAFFMKDLSYVLGALIVPLIFKLTFHYQEKRAYRKNPQLHHMMMTISFYEDYIVQDSTLGSVTIYHYQIQDILETQTNYYILTGSNGTVMIKKEECSMELLEYLRKLKDIKDRKL